MPIILDQHTNEGAHILVWHDEEPLNFFLEQTKLSTAELARLNKYSVMRRKKDLVIARYLIQQSLSEAKVAYHANGKPYLMQQEAEISISHSKDIVAVILHPNRIVGIDIEYITPRVERVKQRFLSAKELLAANSTELLTLYWSAKETLFKLDQKQGLEFNTELLVSLQSASTLIGQIHNGKDITIHYTMNKEWVLTYAVI